MPKSRLETTETDLSRSSDYDEHLHIILQCTNINGVNVETELDSEADRSTIPWELFQEKLVGVCELGPTNVTLYQYDKSHLKIKRAVQGDSSIYASF